VATSLICKKSKSYTVNLCRKLAKKGFYNTDSAPLMESKRSPLMIYLTRKCVIKMLQYWPDYHIHPNLAQHYKSVMWSFTPNFTLFTTYCQPYKAKIRNLHHISKFWATVTMSLCQSFLIWHARVDLWSVLPCKISCYSLVVTDASDGKTTYLTIFIITLCFDAT